MIQVLIGVDTDTDNGDRYALLLMAAPDPESPWVNASVGHEGWHTSNYGELHGFRSCQYREKS